MSDELLVGYGRAAAGDRALDVAARLAVRLGARLRVVHVVDAADHQVDPDAATFDSDVDARLAEQHAHVDEWLRGHGGGVGWEQDVRHGDPVAALSRAAEEHDALMIVVASRGGGAANLFSRVLEPSVSQGLTRRQSRPVLVVPE